MRRNFDYLISRFRRKEVLQPSSTRLQIYSAHHTRPMFQSSHGVFIPIWGGGKRSSEELYEVDDKIPRKTTLGYNETALHYYVWKHLLDETDYIGFEHYRRMFLFPCLFDGIDDLPTPVVPPGWWHAYADDALFAKMLQARIVSSPLRIAALKIFLSSVDIVLPIPSTTETLKEQWIWCQYGVDNLEKLVHCIKRTAAYRAAPFDIDVNAKKTYFCNMFVMKTAIFSSYMELWEQVMFAMQEEVDFSSRMPAYMSERLFSLYFSRKIIDLSLKVAEIPFCLCQSRKVEEQYA